MSRIYLDNNSTTPLLPEVMEAMRECAFRYPGNPASAHRTGAAARRKLEEARQIISDCLGAFPDEVIFTSGATEANNLAIFGLAADKPGMLAVSTLEHPSILEPCRKLESYGWTIVPWNIDGKGYVSGIRNNIKPDLITLQLANHETGTVQNITHWRANYPHVHFHCDGTQAVGKIPVHFHELGINTLALSAHKFHGPVGIGALLLNRCTTLHPRVYGGHQQKGLRPGTESVALAMGMAKALQMAVNALPDRQAKCLHFRRLFLQLLREHEVDHQILGDSEHGLVHALNLSFTGCANDLLLIRLDLAGIDCSTGSACSSGSMLASPVLQAMNVPVSQSKSSIRLSLSHLLTDEQITEAVAIIAREVRALRVG